MVLPESYRDQDGCFNCACCIRDLDEVGAWTGMMTCGLDPDGDEVSRAGICDYWALDPNCEE